MTAFSLVVRRIYRKRRLVRSSQGGAALTDGDRTARALDCSVVSPKPSRPKLLGERRIILIHAVDDASDMNLVS